jgi:Zn-dependent protease with chaperone function
MPLLLLLMLTLACLPDHWPPPWAWIGSAEWTIVYTWLAVVAVVAFAGLLTAHMRRLLARAPGQRERLLHRYHTWRFYHQIGLFLIYGVVLYIFKWGWAVQILSAPAGPPDAPLFPGAELFVLAPLLIGLILSWCCFYDADRAFHNVPAPPDLDRAFQSAAAAPEPAKSAFWSRWTHLGFQVRHNLALVFIPVSLIILIKALGRLIPESSIEWQQIASFGGMIATGLLFFCMPWVLRLVLGLKPLPEGPLRSRLLATSRRLHFRSSNILLWNTKGHVANAMVAGFVPWLRYVILTDRLVSELTPEEIEAVYGHEIGHIKHHHMVFYLGFLLASIAALWAGYSLLQEQLNWWSPLDGYPDSAIPPFVGLVGVYLFVVFGFLSRRCERQADLYGCRAVSCNRTDCLEHPPNLELAATGHGLCPTGIHTFMDALEKVGHVNGISRDRPGWLQSWQHSTIARRIDFLHQVLTDQSVEKRFQKRVALVKCALLLGVGAVLVTLAQVTTWEKLVGVDVPPPSSAADHAK